MVRLGFIFVDWWQKIYSFLLSGKKVGGDWGPFFRGNLNPAKGREGEAALVARIGKRQGGGNPKRRLNRGNLKILY